MTVAPVGTGTVLAFDLGSQVIGVAVGELGMRLAHPLKAVLAGSEDARFRVVTQLLEQWRPALLVVGLPLDEAGGEQEMTRRARRFARQLEGRYRLPVALVDERFTSSSAAESVRGASRRAQKQLDSIAAREILQSYFDTRPEPTDGIHPGTP